MCLWFCLFRHDSPADAETIHKDHPARAVRRGFHGINGCAALPHHGIGALHFLLCVVLHGQEVGVAGLEGANDEMVNG